MSANNYILMKQTKTGWTVSMRDADSESVYSSMRFRTAEQALSRCYEIQENEGTEYGVRIEK